MSRYKGLYNMPLSHLYGAGGSPATPRPMYNSMAFVEPNSKSKPKPAAAEEHALAMADAAHSKPNKDKKSKKDKHKRQSEATASTVADTGKKAKKKKEEQSLLKSETKSLNATVKNKRITNANTDAAMAHEPKAKSGGTQKQNSNGECADQDVNQEPQPDMKLAKKRKRHSKVRFDLPSTPDAADHEYAALGTGSLQHLSSPTVNLAANSKMVHVADTSAGTPTTANKKSKKQRRESAGTPQYITQTPPSSQKPAPRTDSTYMREPNNTPIPLPPNLFLGTASTMASPQLPLSQQTPGDAETRALAQEFNSAFQALTTSVNMIDELVYLNQHLELCYANDAAGPLPCLKSMTGCNSRAEQQILSSKEKTANSLDMTANSNNNRFEFEVAVAANIEAEKFLRNAVSMGIPIPTGNLEGRYQLYCPKYVEAHVDKYGLGLRELYISRPAGITNNTYIARLVIPPRPVAYSVLSFTTPVNASFRTIKLTTSAESYTMDLVVLGNGYILLRVDIGLFLTGKRTVMSGTIGQEICMQFVGIKEGATKWCGMDDVETAKAKDRQRLEELAEKEKADKMAKEQAWVARKEEMALEKERLKAGNMFAVQSSPIPIPVMSVASSPVKRRTATNLDDPSTPSKSKAATTKPRTPDPKHPKTARTAGVSMTSKPPNKQKPSAPLPTDNMSPSPKKRGRPTNVDIIKRAMEKEARERAQA